MQKPRDREGWTLLEIVVAVVLVAIALIVIVALIPTTVGALKKSENIQAATLYAIEVLEDARRADFVPVAAHRSFVRTLPINGILFNVQRDIYGVDDEERPASTTWW